MPRKKKKALKLANKKTVNKQKSKPINLIHLHNLEQEIFKTPDKITSVLNKLITSQKKKEIKLNKAIEKIKALCRKIEGKLDIFNEASITPAIKKRINKIKKNYATQYKIQSQLDKQLIQVSEDLALLNDSQEKYKFLGDYLANFKNEWNKKNKPIKLKKEKKHKKNQNVNENFQVLMNEQSFEPENSVEEIIVEEIID